MKSSETSLLAVPDLRALMVVGFVSFIVRWLEMLAMALFAYQATGSAFVVAMLTMARVLPMGLFGAFIGAAAERFALRSGLIVMVAVSMGSTLALAMLASLDALQVWHLAAASFVNGTCWAADNPIRRVMIGNAVGPERMGAAISLDVAASNASRILGPIAGGILLARYGIASTFWFALALYAASLFAALRVRTRGADTAAPPSSIIAGIRDGFRWLRGDRRLIGAFLVTVLFNIFAWPYASMIPVISTGYFRLDPGGVGLLASCEGIGGLFGAFLFARHARAEWYGRIYLGATALYLATAIGFATVPLVPLAAGMLFLNGMSGVGFSVMQATIVYRHSPVEMRTRLMGVLSVCIGAGPIGFMYLGFLADVLTPRVATVALALQGMLALLLTRRYWIAVVRA